MKFRCIALLMAVAAAYSLSACGSRGDEAEKASISFGGPPNLSILPLVALDHGDFARQGLAARYVTIQTAKLTLDAVLAGSIEAGLTVDANVAGAALAGSTDFRVIAVSQIKRDDGLVVSRRRGIRTAADIKGKSIGYIPGTTSDVFLSRYLKSIGLTKQDVSLVPSTPPALQAAMMSGELDGASIWQPFRSNILASSADFQQFRNDGQYIGTVFLVVRPATLVGKRRALEKLIAGLQQAADHAKADQRDVITIAAKRMGMPAATLAGFWSDYDLVVAAPGTGTDAILQAYAALDPARARRGDAASAIAPVLDNDLWRQ